jgi:hypothetical protein
MNAPAIATARQTTALNLVDPSEAQDVAPSTALTPIQMAYNLMARGVDFASIKEMIDFGREEKALAAQEAFNTAMTAAQQEMSPIATNANNSQTKSRYATYDQLDRAMRPIYTKHGFALSFDEADQPKSEMVRIVCFVSHIGGFTRTYHRDMPADGKGAKGGDVMTKTHAAGAAASYAMRYLLRGIFNVAVGEEDKDGNKVSATISAEQVEELQALIDKAVEAKGGDRAEWLAAFLDYLHVGALLEISTKDFGKAKAEIEHAIRQGAKK